MGNHAKLSPSSASRWMACPGSIALEEGHPDSTSEFAAEGTAAHFLAEQCLTTGVDAIEYQGRHIILWTHPESDAEGCDFADEIGPLLEQGAEARHSFPVDRDMAAFVQVYLNTVRDAAAGGTLLVEQRLSIEHLTGEPGAKGTSDTVIVTDTELHIRDLKYGRGVKVDAIDNAQLRIYALAALAEFDLLADFETVRTAIDQPRLDHISEEVLTVQELRAFGAEVNNAASRVTDATSHYAAALSSGALDQWVKAYLAPGAKQCKWCKAKAECPALEAEVADVVAVAEDFENLETPEPPAGMSLDYIGKHVLPKLDMVEDWVKAVRARAHEALETGEAVPGWKLVNGRRGARAWGSKAEAEEAMKSMRLKKDDMYDFKIISPTQAEKLLKDNPKRWARLAPLIVQPEGRPSMVPEDDKRSAVSATVDDFEDLTQEVA